MNVHSVGDHDHCGLKYICKALNPEELKINKELKGFKWLSIDELDQVLEIIKIECLEAFRVKTLLEQNQQ